MSDVFLHIIVVVLPRYLENYYFLLEWRFHKDLKVYLFLELQNKFRGCISSVQPEIYGGAVSEVGE